MNTSIGKAISPVYMSIETNPSNGLKFVMETMRKNSLLLITVLSLVLSMGACTSNSKDDLPKPVGGNNCDTANMNYADEVRGIFTKHSCLSCHNTQNPSGQVNLDTYSDAVQSANLLLPALRHDPNLAPSKHMPQGAPDPIPQCEILKIEAWINAGTPE